MTLTSNPTLGCPLVFACDGGYAMPLTTTLRSVAEANQGAWPLEIYILSDGFSEPAKSRIVDSLPKGSCSIHWLPVDLSVFAGFSTLKHISTVTYARLLLANSLPASISRVLYLDADLLVLDDLAPICRLDLDGAVMGAVVDRRLDTYIKDGNTTLLGRPISSVRDYFNAGVLLIDLARWRAERTAEKALEYLERYPNSLYSDQDALNFACDGVWKNLDSRWNYYQIDLDRPVQELSAAERPAIIHFHGCFKPWDPGALNWNAGFYDSFRSRTRFARTPAEKLRELPIAAWARSKKLLKRSLMFMQSRSGTLRPA